MTPIVRGSIIQRVRYTQNAKELAEVLGYDICGKEIINVVERDGLVRGYVVFPLNPLSGSITRGPVTLFKDDIEEVHYT